MKRTPRTQGQFSSEDDYKLEFPHNFEDHGASITLSSISFHHAIEVDHNNGAQRLSLTANINILDHETREDLDYRCEIDIVTPKLITSVPDDDGWIDWPELTLLQEGFIGLIDPHYSPRIYPLQASYHIGSLRVSDDAMSTIVYALDAPGSTKIALYAKRGTNGTYAIWNLTLHRDSAPHRAVASQN